MPFKVLLEYVSGLIHRKCTTFNTSCILFTGNRHPTKLTTTKTLKLTDSESASSSSNRKANSQTPMQERNCKSKSKIKKQKLNSQTCKNFSFSLSQPVLSANPTSSKRVLQNWQPPLKILCYDNDKENTTENSSHQDIMSSADKVSSEESNGNEETTMDNKGVIAEKAQTESDTISCNGNNLEDKSLSQQSTQEYVATKNEMKVKKGKYKDTDRAKANTTEISSAIQETGKKELGNNYHEVTYIISNKDTDSSNIRIKADEKDCNTSFIEHSEERMDQCFVHSKHTQNNSSQVSTKENVGRKHDMKDNAGETSRENIMNKSENIILPSDKNFLTQMHKSSDCEDEPKTKPNPDSVMLQIQSLTVKSPVAPAQYMHSIKTLTGNVEESPLPLDLVLKDTWNHSQLTLDKSEEMEPTKIQTMSQATTTFMISEQKSRANKCEGADVSGQILTAQAETDKNNHLPLVAREAQTVCNFENELVTKCEESTYTSNPLTDLPINKSEVNLDKMIKNIARSPSVAAKAPEICNAESTMLQRHTEQGDMETTSLSLDTMTPKILPDTNLDLNNQSESSKMATNVCDMKTAMMKRQKEVGNIKTTPQSLDAATPDDYSEKIKNPSESQVTAANKCITEHLIERYEKASNTASCSNKNETDEPAEIDNCFKHPEEDTGEGIEDGVKVENTELLSAGHPSTSNRNEFLPKQNEINQSKVGFNKFKDKFCKSPTAATEAPNVCNTEKINEDPLTNENIPDTASHGYLLDDDIGLTGSQLLRIEDECQYNIQGTEEVRNHAYNHGKARVPDIAVSAHIPPPPNWAQNVHEKRQKLRSIIQDISRIK